MKRILVTGANGFVGKSLITSLIKNDYAVTAACRHGKESLTPGQNINYVHFELGKPDEDYDLSLKDVDVVVHLAARVHFDDSKSANKKKHYYETNVLGTKLLAEAAAKKNVKRFIFLSTIKVNGETNSVDSKNEPIAFEEDNVPEPEDLYANSKLQAETELREICKKSQMEFVILRPALIYGPGVKANFLSLIKFVINGKFPFPLSSINNKRSFIYIGNLVDAILQCIESPNVKNKLYLLNDTNISVPDLIKQIAAYSHKKIFMFPFPVFILKILFSLVGKRKLVSRLTDSLIIDNSKFIEDLKWCPPFTFDEGIKETLKWYDKETKTC